MNNIQLLTASNCVSICLNDEQVFSFEISQLSEAKYVFILQSAKVYCDNKWVDTFSNKDNTLYKQNKEIIKRYKYKTLLDLIFDKFSDFVPMMVQHILNNYHNTKKELLLYHITPDGKLLRFCRYNKPSGIIYMDKFHRRKFND